MSESEKDSYEDDFWEDLGCLLAIPAACCRGISSCCRGISHYVVEKLKHMNVKREMDKLLAKSNGAQLLWLLILSALCLSVALFVSYHVFGDGKVPWQDVVAIFLDPGCFGGPGEHDFFRLGLALLSIFLFSALLVSVFTNLFENIREAAQSGNRRYRLRNHVIILGYCPQVKDMFARPEVWRNTVVIVDEDRPDLEEDFIFYKGAREKREDLETIGAEYAQRIYIMGDPDDPEHDEKNLKALCFLENLCYNAPRKVPCIVALSDHTTTEVMQYYRGWYGMPDGGQLLWDTVNVCDYEAELLFSPYATGSFEHPFLPVLRSGDKRRAHIVVIGTGEMAQSVAYMAAHICHYPNFTECGVRTLITFVGEGMRRWKYHLEASRPALFAMSRRTFVSGDGTKEVEEPAGRDFLDVEWQFVDAEAESPVARRIMEAEDDTVLRIVVCHADSRRGFNDVLHLPRSVCKTGRVAMWVPKASRIDELVYATGMYSFMQTFGPGCAEAGLSTCDWADPVFRRRFEAAKRVNLVYHRAYVDADCTDEEQAWRTISESDKYSSVYCAAAMHLRSVCFDMKGDRRPIYEAEHRRWMMSELLMGFSPAPVTNKERFEHADLVPFDELPPGEQEKDRILINNMNYILYGNRQEDLS